MLIYKKLSCTSKNQRTRSKTRKSWTCSFSRTTQNILWDPSRLKHSIFQWNFPCYRNVAPLGFQPLLSIILETVSAIKQGFSCKWQKETNKSKASRALEQWTNPRITRQNGNDPSGEGGISAGAFPGKSLTERLGLQQCPGWNSGTQIQIPGFVPCQNDTRQPLESP